MSRLPPLTKSEKQAQRTLILAALKILNCDQSELARKMKINRSMVSRMCNGIIRISPDNAMKLNNLIPDITLKELCPRIYK